jgi:hypothetical protein
VKLSYKAANHSYFLDGKRCRNISSVAKIPDDDWNLSKWRQRMVLLGAAINPTLATRAAAHHDDKSMLNQLVEEALSAARAHDAAGMGTASHRIAERVDLNLPVVETVHGTAVTTAWRAALQSTGLEIVPDYVERVVVHPPHLIAGRFDRLVYDTCAQRLRVLDLKTGESAINYPHAIATQLALYAHAPLIAAPLAEDGGTTEDLERMPDVDPDVGLVVHMPTPTEATVYEVDIAAGWDCFIKVILPTLAWRKRDDLVTVAGQAKADESLVIPLLRSYVLRRLDVLRSEHPACLQSLAARWPADLPTLKQSEGHTEAQLDVVLALLSAVEADHGVPFPYEDDPRKEPTQQTQGASA